MLKNRLSPLLLLLSLLLSACASAIPAPSATPRGSTPASLPPSPPAPTLTLSLPAAATPPLPSVTVAPSLTPSLTPTPQGGAGATPQGGAGATPQGGAGATPQGGAGATLPPAQPIAYGPYLQDGVPGSLWVVWDTASPSTGWVSYGQPGAPQQLAVEAAPARHHQVQLSGLADYAPYTYQVGGDPSPASFTSPAGPAQNAFHFAVLGDTRANPPVHAAICQAIAAARPDLILHTGDQVDNGADAGLWDAFLKIEEPMLRLAPLYPTLGNHEGNSPLYFQLFRLPGKGSYYTLDYANARFIILKVDSYDPTPFAAGGEQRAWLEEQLKGASGRWIFVSFHVPLHTSFSEDPSEVNLRMLLAPLFEQYHVAVVFSGHVHSYERVLANGITYVVTGGGGAPFYTLNVKEPGQQAAALVYHYMLIDINGNTLTARAISVDGKQIDSFTQQR